MTKFNELTISDAQKKIIKGEISCRELVLDCLAKIKQTDEKVKAFVTLNSEKALSLADEEDKRLAFLKDTKQIGNLFRDYPLLGIPVAVKDNFSTKGLLTTASAKVLENYKPVFDASVVKKINDAGGIILGKTNMDAWAHGSSTESSDFFTTRNPWNLERLAGGSSGGSAAAVAADLTIAAIGSETAGSIRQPACWCGVVGMKPTYGRVSRYGVIAMASSTDSPGPITKSVSDAALMLGVIAGKDEADATSSPTSVPDYLTCLGEENKIKGIKIGVAKQYFLKGIDSEVEKNAYQAIKILEKAGAQIKEISLLDPKYAVAVYTVIQRSEVSSNLGRYDGIRFGHDRSYFKDEAKRRIMFGTYSLSAGYYDQYYKKAQKVRTLIGQDFEKAFKEVDLIIGPTSPCPALGIGATKEASMFGEMQDILLEASSVAGLPAISLPSGFSSEGLPTGIQIIGPSFSEEQIFKTAFIYEKIARWHERKPKL
ncbi:MAG: Glutamyl-tRNA(Gln) amidotransferase subunit A [Microgenomates group bacterium ADurb.Bin219]|nr:MAG: Glutamyl-tRNA(Gln) amidotransferase subunit A [Microgenomates group bacterium ADurb.Bin219]HNP89363.1 Asp-tRNA(Asn)/Glu-tRNA(Gln) amidotransferase subunit GatA [Candidatus Woesebacteria bacterium]